MRFWREKLILPVHVRENEHLNMVAGVKTDMWPDCLQCTNVALKARFDSTDFKSSSREYQECREIVTSYGVQDCGRTTGGTDYTDEFAIHHGERDIIRIEGFRWDAVVKEAQRMGEAYDWAPILAGIKALPFFGPGALRLIPKHVWLNFMTHYGRRN